MNSIHNVHDRIISYHQNSSEKSKLETHNKPGKETYAFYIWNE